MTMCPIANLFVKGKRGVLDKQSPHVNKLSNDPGLCLFSHHVTTQLMHVKHSKQFLALCKHLINI